MRTMRPPSRILKAASDALVEFALLSFAEEFLLWEKSVNLCMAELVWNAYRRGVDPREATASRPALKPLVRRLMRARRVRWRKERFLVSGLDVRVEGAELIFSFKLTWDEGATFHPCEITVGMNCAGPADLN